MQWYYSRNGSQLGPVSLDELQAKLATGQVAWTDLVWRDGMADWTPAGQVADLRPVQPDAAAPGAPPLIPPQSPYAPPAQAYIPPGTMQEVTTSGLAIASLILGICVCLAGILTGIPAVICGHLALSQIHKDPVRVGGRGLAVTGLVFGYLSIAMLVFALILVLGRAWAIHR